MDGPILPVYGPIQQKDYRLRLWNFYDYRLAVKAVENACLNVKTTEGIILHSDLGSCYTSSEFESFLYSKGNPYDNACIESFHSLLKKEEVNRRKYYDFNAARKAIFEYIESWYNRKEFMVLSII